MALSSVPDILDDIRAGKMVILMDDEDRENEGDLTMAAEKVTPQSINFMAKYGRGLICLPMTAAKIDSLDLPPMVDNNTSPYGTGFTVSIEARCGVSTGISAADRATTILAAVADGDAEAGATDVQVEVRRLGFRRARHCRGGNEDGTGCDQGVALGVGHELSEHF